MAQRIAGTGQTEPECTLHTRITRNTRKIGKTQLFMPYQLKKLDAILPKAVESVSVEMHNRLQKISLEQSIGAIPALDSPRVPATPLYM